MKIKCKTEGYSGPAGTFTKDQVREVSETDGAYLLKTFPNWFTEVKSEPKPEPEKRDMKPDHDTAMRAGSTRKRGRGKK